MLEGDGLTEGWLGEVVEVGLRKTKEPSLLQLSVKASELAIVLKERESNMVDLSVVCTFDETGFPKVVGLSMKASPIRPGDDGAGLELAAQVRNGSCCRSLADGLKEGSRWKQRFSMPNS